MNAGRRNIDKVSVLNATWRAKQRIEGTITLAYNFTNDPEKIKRQEEQLCPVCYYIHGRCGGAAMTTIQCGLCDKSMTFGNTCVDSLCKECGYKHQLCVHCGADIELKQRRKERF